MSVGTTPEPSTWRAFAFSKASATASDTVAAARRELAESRVEAIPEQAELARFADEAIAAAEDRMAGDASIHELRIVALQIATSNTLVDIDREPVGFNRHGTQHGAPAHFTKPAMLASVMLLVGWIRELSDLAEHIPRCSKTRPQRLAKTATTDAGRLGTVGCRGVLPG
jgi:hypothetical protein